MIRKETNIDVKARTHNIGLQYGGFSAKFKFSFSIEFIAKLKLCASISATSPSRGTLAVIVKNDTVKSEMTSKIKN